MIFKIKGNSESSSVFNVLNKCQTNQGQKLLFSWIHQPLTDINKISNQIFTLAFPYPSKKLKDERLDLVEELVSNFDIYNLLKRDFLSGFPDLNVFGKKFLTKQANLKDCYRVFCAFKKLDSLIRQHDHQHDEIGDSNQMKIFNNLFLYPLKVIFQVEWTV